MVSNRPWVSFMWAGLGRGMSIRANEMIPVIKWWALCPAANDADTFDIPMRAIAQKWVYEGLGEYL